MGGNDTTQSKRNIDSLFAFEIREEDVCIPTKPNKDNSFVEIIGFPTPVFRTGEIAQ